MRVVALICGLLLLSGCGVSVTPNPEPVDVSVTVTAGGKPVTDVKFNFQPIGDGLPAVVDLTDGKLQAKVTPGEYTWFVSPGKKENSFAAIPAVYHEGSLDRQLKVNGGDVIELKLD